MTALGARCTVGSSRFQSAAVGANRPLEFGRNVTLVLAFQGGEILEAVSACGGLETEQTDGIPRTVRIMAILEVSSGFR